MTPLYSNPPLADFVLSEASGQRSRDNGTVKQTGAAILSGTVLTKEDTATTGTYALVAGSTGDPTSSAVAVSGPAVPGVYRGVFLSATDFTVESPSGVPLGVGTLGTEFDAGGLTFTLTAGTTPAVAGDAFTMTVAAGTGLYIPYTASGAAGAAVAILYSNLPAEVEEVTNTDVVTFTNDCEVRRGALIGLDATAEAQLALVGIKVRGTAGLAHVSTPAL